MILAALFTTYPKAGKAALCLLALGVLYWAWMAYRFSRAIKELDVRE